MNTNTLKNGSSRNNIPEKSFERHTRMNTINDFDGNRRFVNNLLSDNNRYSVSASTNNIKVISQNFYYISQKYKDNTENNFINNKNDLANPFKENEEKVQNISIIDNINISNTENKEYINNINYKQLNYYIFLRKNKSNTNFFSISIILIVNKYKSICYRIVFLLNDFIKKVLSNKMQFNSIDNIFKYIGEIIINNDFKVIYDDNNNEKIYLKLILSSPENEGLMELKKVHEYYGENDYSYLGNMNEERSKINIGKTKEIINKTEKDIEIMCNDIDKKLSKLYEKDNYLRDFTSKIENLGNEYLNLLRNKNMTSKIIVPKFSEEQLRSMPDQERYRILGIPSDIVYTPEEVIFISRCLSQEKATRLTLVYKSSVDGFSSVKFHVMCDNFIPTLIILEAGNGARFGGYTNNTWKGENMAKNDPGAFLFSIDFKEKYPINPSLTKLATNAKTNLFFCFGKDDLIIRDNCDRVYNTCNFPNVYMGPEKAKLVFGRASFSIKRIEVFQVHYIVGNEDI